MVGQQLLDGLVQALELPIAEGDADQRRDEALGHRADVVAVAGVNALPVALDHQVAMAHHQHAAHLAGSCRGRWCPGRPGPPGPCPARRGRRSASRPWASSPAGSAPADAWLVAVASWRSVLVQAAASTHPRPATSSRVQRERVVAVGPAGDLQWGRAHPRRSPEPTPPLACSMTPPPRPRRSSGLRQRQLCASPEHGHKSQVRSRNGDGRWYAPCRSARHGVRAAGVAPLGAARVMAAHPRPGRRAAAHRRGVR